MTIRQKQLGLTRSVEYSAATELVADTLNDCTTLVLNPLADSLTITLDAVRDSFASMTIINISSTYTALVGTTEIDPSTYTTAYYNGTEWTIPTPGVTKSTVEQMITDASVTSAIGLSWDDDQPLFVFDTDIVDPTTDTTAWDFYGQFGTANITSDAHFYVPATSSLDRTSVPVGLYEIYVDIYTPEDTASIPLYALMGDSATFADVSDTNNLYVRIAPQYADHGTGRLMFYVGESEIFLCSRGTTVTDVNLSSSIYLLDTDNPSYFWINCSTSTTTWNGLTYANNLRYQYTDITIDI